MKKSEIQKALHMGKKIVAMQSRSKYPHTHEITLQSLDAMETTGTSNGPEHPHKLYLTDQGYVSVSPGGKDGHSHEYIQITDG